LLGPAIFSAPALAEDLLMRIAISGTHCCGKSTLIDQFLLRHSDYSHEAEPYVVLEEDYGEVFAADPSSEDFYRQLEFNVERLRHHKAGDRVIYERSPVDFLAYMLALNDLGRDRESSQLVETSLNIVREAIHLIDLIVFLPVGDDEPETVMADSEDPELRTAVNSRLEGLFHDDKFDLFAGQRPEVLEARGSTIVRLRTLQGFLDSR
jgi:hypothetical protein